MIPARLTRVLGAIIYDLIIVFAIIFIAAQWFPLIPESSQHNPAITLFKQAYILGISFLYFAYSWRRGGQTIGMNPGEFDYVIKSTLRIKFPGVSVPSAIWSQLFPG